MTPAPVDEEAARVVVQWLVWLVPSLGGGAAVVLVLLLFPEKIEKWSALLWKLLSRFGSLFGAAHKRYVKHDLQGRVNDFVRQLRRQVPTVANEKLKIEYVDPNTARSAFLDRGEVILRLRRDDPRDENFVHGAYLFVSHTLLSKAKRYLSPSQRQAIDLFVCTKLLEREKPAIVGIFLDEYLHPATSERKSAVALYVDDFAIIDKAGYFFSMLLQELEYLGEKVFGRRRDDRVHSEVKGLIQFLKPIATRKIGDEGDLTFDGAYCRFGIVIVGKPSKMIVSLDPYVKYIARELAGNGSETIYLLARKENRKAVEEICVRFRDRYVCARRTQFKTVFDYGSRKENATQYLAVLRLTGQAVIQTSRD